MIGRSVYPIGTKAMQGSRFPWVSPCWALENKSKQSGQVYFLAHLFRSLLGKKFYPFRVRAVRLENDL